MAVGIYVLHLHPGEEEIRRTFLREAAECVDPVRCKKVQRLKSTGAKAASLGAGMLLQKMALDLIDGTENTGILFLEEDELLAVLQERMHRDKAGALSFSYEYGELGKPQIVNIPKKFNLSHSGDYVVCAVGDGEVGPDHFHQRNETIGLDGCVYPDPRSRQQEKHACYPTRREDPRKDLDSSI